MADQTLLRVCRAVAEEVGDGVSPEMVYDMMVKSRPKVMADGILNRQTVKLTYIGKIGRSQARIGYLRQDETFKPAMSKVSFEEGELLSNKTKSRYDERNQ